MTKRLGGRAPRPPYFFATIALLTIVSAACANPEKVRDEARHLTGGDPNKGERAILHYGCQACHTIPGVPGATASVGPPLDKWQSRAYIGGRLSNTPENLVRFIQNPQTHVPAGAMPNMGVTTVDAKDIAAYLYTLK
jgi:cytochrome c